MLNSQTERLLAKLIRQQQGALDRARREPPAQWLFRPSPSAWSTADVFDHLVRVEREYVSGLRAGLAQPRHAPQVAERIRTWMVIGVMHSPVRVGMPSAVADKIRPAPASDFEVCAQSWIAAREELAGVVRASNFDVRAGVLRHPVSGWMTVNDALRVLYAHTRHHEYQLDRLRLKAGEMSVSVC